MNDSLDTKIEQLQNQLTSLLGQMEGLSLQFIQETSTFAQEWYQKTAIAYLVKNPQVTRTLNRQRIAMIKDQVKALQRNSYQNTNKAFSRPNIWWHKNPTINISINAYEQLGNQQSGRKYPTAVDDCVRIALGELGIVLEKFGFNVSTQRQFSEFKEYWFSNGDGNNSVYPYFPHLLDWSEEMQAILLRYNVFFKSARLLFSQIQELKDTKKSQEITEIWQTID
jgi:hypothetical protein